MRPFRLFGNRQLAALQLEAGRLVGGWAADWLIDGPAELTVQAATAPMLPGPWLSMRSGRATGFVARPAGAIEAALFGEVAREQPSVLAAEVGDAALADLLCRCLEAADGTLPGSEAPPPELWRRGAGALCVRRQGRAGALELLVDAGITQRWLARHPAPARPPAPLQPLQPLRPAIGSARVRVEASVGEAEIDIATLQSLVVGDVLLLDHRIDHPVRLGVVGQAATRSGHLGCADGRRALQLVAGNPAPDQPVPRKSP